MDIAVAPGRSRLWLFGWIALAVMCGALVPRFAEIAGMHVAGQAWNLLKLSSPMLSQTGELLGGLIGGALVGFLQWLMLRRFGVRASWIVAALCGGLVIAAAVVAYRPLAVLVAPLAGGVSGLPQQEQLPKVGARWPKAQALGAAWVALALLLPFPRWVSAAFILGAALLSASAIRHAD